MTDHGARERLLPEFLVLRDRIRRWRSELERVARTIPLPAGDASPFKNPLKEAERIAATLDREIAGFLHEESDSIEPEELRRLLIKGEQLSTELASRSAAFDEVTFCREQLTALCNRLLRTARTTACPEHRALVQRLSELAAPSRLYFSPVESRGANSLFDASTNSQAAPLPAACRRNAPAVIEAGVLAGRIAARMLPVLQLSRERTDALLTASLLHDCGFLLLEERLRRPPEDSPDQFGRGTQRHSKLGAALAGGLRNIPADALAAIAAHHRVGNDGPGRLSNSGGVVGTSTALICRFVELFREYEGKTQDGSAPRRSPLAVSLEQLEAEVRFYKQDRCLFDVLQSVLREAAVETPLTSIGPTPMEGTIASQCGGESQTVPPPHFMNPAKGELSASFAEGETDRAGVSPGCGISDHAKLL